MLIENKKQNAFTLVELIVVIVILAILATIAFISFSSQSGSARDSSRLSDMASIKKTLELFNVNSGSYPMPDNSSTVTYSGGTMWNQGTFGDNSFKLTSKNLSKKVSDPITGNEYRYSLASNKKELQIAGNFENPISLKRYLGPFEPISSGFAAGTGSYFYISGNYNGLVLKVQSGSTFFYVPTPTLFTTFTGGVIYDASFGSGKVLLPGTQTANYNSTSTYTVTSTNLTNTDLSNLVSMIQNAYSGSNIVTSEVQLVLNSSGSSLLTLMSGLIQNSLGSSIVSSSGTQSCTTGLYWNGSACAAPSIGYNVSTVAGQDVLYAGIFSGRTLWLATAETGAYWKSSDTSTETSIDNFDGRTNMATIKTVDSTLANHPAAKYCANLNWAGYTDWYLPAMSYTGGTTANCSSQLGEMQFLYCQNKGGGSGSLLSLSGSSDYWSSSEYLTTNTSGARSLRFDTGVANAWIKNSTRKVRCIRVAN